MFLVPLSMATGALKVGVPANLTRRDGYDNQAAFALSSRELFYTSNRGDEQTDIYRYDFNTGRRRWDHRVRRVVGCCIERHYCWV